ncbi:MAG: hypothetical protein LBR27_07165 [Bifidobacteriaceae bacterium]|jgi:hypothetical protein|nr:hypothetical protein [Bifidobacteriaceae bacterium]
MEFDRYGGWTGRRFAATGFFRLAQAERWWLVTPEGNAHLSLGLNHVEPSPMTSPHNLAFWAGRLGLPPDAAADAFLPGFLAKVRADAAHLGAGAIGCHSHPAAFGLSIPYVPTVRALDICHYLTPGPADFRDPFDPAFADHCDRVARAGVRPEDPYLLGYFLTDCPVLTDLEAAPREPNLYGNARPGLPTYPRVLRNLPGHAPGKRVYVRLMVERHGSIEAFNRAYATGFSSFDSLERAVDWRPATDKANRAERADNQAFLALVMEQAWRTQAGAIRRHDPNHLVLGDKLNGNTDLPSAIVQAAANHFDLVFYQMYGFAEEELTLLQRWRRLTHKPFLLGDANITVATPEMPNPYGPVAPDQAARRQAFLEAAGTLFEQPQFVGWHWCGWMDQWESVQPGKQHSGLQDPFGRWHPVAQAFKAVAAGLYRTPVG